ncbi:PREDICTED: starch-binding domain-containing protein 1 [Condylura cristata]|uniref:starch-binding domain-containing protein 1 n=1 Tax=Condylura cristata TaxID=143302 RepID=UPI00033479E0|nr:PREDICTED: starch-binding domain-containing protein 1 [Condylura cristata]
MGTVWSALLVGGGLAGALFVWLLRDKGKDAGAEPDPDARLGEPGGDQAGGGLNPGPSRRELVTKPEHPQGNNGCLLSDKGNGNLQEGRWRPRSPGEGGNCSESRENVSSGWFPDTQCLAASETRNSRCHSEVSRSRSLESSQREWGFQKGQETPGKATPTFAEKLPSSNLFMDRVEEVSLARMDSQDLTDPEDWEMVSRHSSWGDVGLDGSLEFSMLSSNQGLDCGRSSLVEARGQEVGMKTKRVVRMSSQSQHVSISFQIHYLTSTGVQFIAVTGDHENLGRWNTFVPLQCSKDGLWSHSVSLPADTVVEWKFVVVENGEVTRWEECSNRLLETGHEDKVVHKSWGVQ